jgi:hypothetical protein
MQFLSGRHLALAGALIACAASAQSTSPSVRPNLLPTSASNRLLLTGGVTQIEGAAGGGLTPWALIAGQGTRDEIGGTAFGTIVRLNDFDVRSYGAAIGLYNRVELSYARAEFDTRRVGGRLGLGNGFTISQDILGVKVRLFGDAVLDQDTLLPQVSVGAFYRQNDRSGLVGALGARDNNDIEY